jgi:hypothetical protein
LDGIWLFPTALLEATVRAATANPKKLQTMKKALLILGLAAMAAGCHTDRDRNTGGSEMDTTSSSSSRYSSGQDSSANPATQGSGANSLNNANSSSNSNPNQ